MGDTRSVVDDASADTGGDVQVPHSLVGATVVLVAPLPPPAGGMANQTRQLANLLEQDGFRVHVVRTNAPYSPAWVASLKGVRAVFRLIPFVVRLWKAAGEATVFHVMANSGWSWHLFVAPAVWIARIRGVPVVMNYRGGDAAEFFARAFRWVRPTMAALDARIVPSGYLHGVFRKFGLSAAIVPNIIDLTRFGRARRKRFDSAAPHVIVTRNLEALYDIPTALRAFALIRAKRPDARMTIAGTGPERERLMELSRELGLEPCVRFSGSLDGAQLVALLEEADVVLNSSLHDNMPNSLVEALASGVPVVSSNVCGIPYLVEHGTTAILVPPKDPAALAAGVERLCDEPKQAAGMTEAGLALVANFTWEAVRPRLFGVYCDAIRVAAERRAARAR